MGFNYLQTDDRDDYFNALLAPRPHPKPDPHTPEQERIARERYEATHAPCSVCGKVFGTGGRFNTPLRQHMLHKHGIDWRKEKREMNEQEFYDSQGFRQEDYEDAAKQAESDAAAAEAEAMNARSQSELPKVVEEAATKAIDEAGYIQEFGPGYNRFTLDDCLRGVSAALSAYDAHTVKPLVEVLRMCQRALDRGTISMSESRRLNLQLSERITDALAQYEASKVRG